jgi:RND family efflux transporter MFP subunit
VNAAGSAVQAVNVSRATEAPPEVDVELPASIQPLAEAPVLARADGYLKTRLADIGDRVKAGQVLAEIEAPEVDQQVRQARAAVEQARASIEQASAALEQGQATQQLAGLTADRWSKLLARGAVSRQENDQYQAQFKAQTASVAALGKAQSAAQSNLAAVEANLARLIEVQGYKQVRAPFDGVITLRNIDAGALISAGQTLLYRLAQTGTMRAYINVPQTIAESVRPGQQADVYVNEVGRQPFAGRVARTSQALDPTSRTLLVDIEVPNPRGLLLPGMYAQVRLTLRRSRPVVLVPGDTVVIRARGPEVAVVENGKVHYHQLKVERDHGDMMEVLDGVKPGDMLVVNPGDTAREGSVVETRELPRAEGKK